jgi:adenosine deaminase
VSGWSALPKVELHLHLEGAAPPGLVRDLAAEKGVSLAGLFDEAGAYRRSDFAAFLRAYEAAAAVMVGPEDYARLTRAVLEESAAQGVVYTEVFVSPDLCGGGELGAWREHVEAIEEAARGGPVLRIVATCIRHLGPDRARAAALCAAETAGGFVTGFGMGGDENAGRTRDFAWAFDCAREAGLGITSHAGEWGGPASVRETLEALRPSRIGHGVRAVEDPRLVDDLAERGVVLEVCPGSNVALGAHPSVERHPIARLREAGVPVTVSTDDPPFFGTTLGREWEALERAFGWGPEDLAALNRVALGAAFCDEATRSEVEKLLEAA